MKKEDTIDGKIGKVVGYVIRKQEAIDLTPIYTFVLNVPLQPGDLVEYDMGDNKLIYRGNNTTAA